MKTLRLNLFLVTIALVSAPALSDLVISKVDRRINLSSPIVRITSSIKVVNEGLKPESEVLFAFVERHSENLAYLSVSTSEGKGKAKGPVSTLPLTVM
uniref:Dolichyl-diphosphooligosaccharide--protein glycosyltransferase subunit 1 n=1 Tax=Kalanchoe fedtschenkoi TaxID=63787 RepID=A0A7N0VHM1_KALFE